MHDLPLITTIAVAFTAAWLLGLLTQRLGLSPIVGYLLAGVAIGPHTPGFVGDVHIAQQLAEVGVILLMFGVGLHFHLKDLLAVKRVAVPGALGQCLVATLIGVAAFRAFGMPLATGAVIGMALSVASTVVLMRVLMDADLLSSPQGHIAVGWSLVQDIVTVIVLVLIPVLGTSGGSDPAPASGLAMQLAIALLKLAVLIGMMLVVGARVIPWVLVQVARLRSRELFTLTVLVFSIAMATASYAAFGASMALGAFLAGMVVALSPASYQAAADALPMRDAFAVLFFVSVGALFDPAFVIREPALVLAALAIVLLVKPLTALVIVALLGYSARTSLTVALAMAQIGEFSFILSDLARKHKLMPDAGHNVLVASAIISITLSPLLFRLVGPFEEWLRRRPKLWALVNGRAERRVLNFNRTTAFRIDAQTKDAGLAIVVGFGPVGRSVEGLLNEAGLATTIVDFNMDTITELRSSGKNAVFGDASHEAILEQAGMRRASHLVLTLPQAPARIAVVRAARNLNPGAQILVRAHYLREREDLERAGATAAVFEEGEVAVALARLVLANTGAQSNVMERKIRDLRLQLIVENMSNIRTQRVRSIMVPWTRVRRLSASANRNEVLRHIAEGRYSRWPVTEPRTGAVIGYLLANDLLAAAQSDGAWTDLIRPMRAVRSDDDIESTMQRMQSEGATVVVVEDAGAPVGLLALEDILEQVVGRIEDEYAHEPAVSLQDAVAAGGVVLELQSRTKEAAIAELAAAIPATRLPPDADIAKLALARERDLSTDLGVGIAIPHARCPNLASPLVAFGHSTEGIQFSAQSTEAVRLMFLLVTPLEHPDLQLALLAQIARLAGDEAIRTRLRHATSASEVIDIIAKNQDRPAK